MKGARERCESKTRKGPDNSGDEPGTSAHWSTQQLERLDLTKMSGTAVIDLFSYILRDLGISA